MTEWDQAWQALERAETADQIRAALKWLREIDAGIAVLPSIRQRCILMRDDREHGRL